MKDNAAPEPVKAGAVDIEAFANNLARMVEEGGKALAAYMKPREEGQVQAGLSDEMNDMVKTSARSALAVRSEPRGRIAIPTRLRLSRSVRGGVAPPAKSRTSSRPIRRTAALPIRNGRRTSSSISSSRPICSAPTGRTSLSTRPRNSIRTPGRRPSSTSGSSPTPCRRRTSC